MGDRSTQQGAPVNPEAGGQSGPGHPGTVEASHEQGQYQQGQYQQGQYQQEQGRTLLEEGKQVARDVAARAEAGAIDQISEAVRQLAGLANAFDVAAAQLRAQQQQAVAEQVEAMATGLDRFCDRLAGNDLRALADETRTWARDNPAAFLGGAVAAGFAISRLVKASGSGQSEAATPNLPPTSREELDRLAEAPIEQDPERPHSTTFERHRS